MPDPNKPAWIMRRIMLFSFFFFCLFINGALQVWGDGENVIHWWSNFLTLIGAFLTVISYMGWATWEDISLARLLGVLK